MVEAHAAQLDAYGQRSYKARPSKRWYTGNRMRFARAMDWMDGVAVGAGSRPRPTSSAAKPIVLVGGREASEGLSL